MTGPRSQVPVASASTAGTGVSGVTVGSLVVMVVIVLCTIEIGCVAV